MGRYPFSECLKEYMPNERGHISEETYDAMYRRLKQLGRIFHDLKQKQLVSTDNPKTITPKDIDVFVGQRKLANTKPATILKDLGYLAKLLAFFDNDAVTKFKAKFPAHIPKRFKKRQPAMEEFDVKKIFDKAALVNINDWARCEAYGLVTLAISTGFRSKELRMLSVRNVFVDGDKAAIHAIHVKGEDSYGEDRWVYLHPDGVPMLKKYLEARKIRLERAGKDEDALFPPILNNGGYLSYKRIRILKTFVEKDIGNNFQLRKCRRTFGQRALNEGQDIYNVSLVMGHATLATTQRYYCDKDQKVASAEMQQFWIDKKSGEDS